MRTSFHIAAALLMLGTIGAPPAIAIGLALASLANSAAALLLPSIDDEEV